MKTQVEIAGTKYLLDIDKAKKDGYLTKIPNYPLNAGDVYVTTKPGRCNPLLLVQVTYSADQYQLLGMGASPNSNEFYRGTHSKDEVREYLIKLNMKFAKNVNDAIYKLVDDCD